ncbi:MAG: ROK family protein, partial [Firmicutes bacterium]|nr:ROK family protein [Bacillota bacterium]
MIDMEQNNGSTCVADIGGTHVHVAEILPNGTMLNSGQLQTPRDPDVERVLDVVDQAVGAWSGAWQRVDRIVLGVPGLVDPVGGIARFNANLGWSNIPLRELAERRWSRPVFLDNDVRLHALGELHYGWGRHIQGPWVLVAIGTGIAATFVQDAKVVYGSHFAAGEI